MPDFVKLTRLIKAWHLIGLFGQRSTGQTDSTAAAFAKRDSIIVIGLICSSNSCNSSRHFMDQKSSFYVKLSWKILPLTFPMVTSHNSSTLLTCRVSWKGNYITKIYDVYNLFSHAKKVVHEGVEGNILKDILHWLLIKQKVLSCHAQEKQKAVPFLLWYGKKYLWLLDREFIIWWLIFCLPFSW